MSKKKREYITIQQTKGQARLFPTVVVQIVIASISIIYFIMTLLALNNPDVQSAVVNAGAAEAMGIQPEQAITYLRIMLVVELIVNIAALISGFMGITIISDARSINTFWNMTVFTLVMTSIGLIIAGIIGSMLTSTVVFVTSLLMVIFTRQARKEIDEVLATKLHHKKGHR
ncbi:hypothetical protein [Atopobium sp. oral taxon 416]|uniref:hypothetical protein n=1 Tax=Atopobium sp. oral taxon 416 TaxID=712157 RepID=UPI001BA8D512|nr:hypothetical protein [Atopobium sp. oral taxon 416]QUC04385.1 hypothetical protein J4859_05495 [Atopobium sp. oral taxon 416]